MLNDGVVLHVQVTMSTYYINLGNFRHYVDLREFCHYVDVVFRSTTTSSSPKNHYVDLPFQKKGENLL